MSSNYGRLPQLSSNHEEANTRIILHCKDAIVSGCQRILVDCMDTDVLLMLIRFFGHEPVDVWMLSGTKRRSQCFPVSKIAEGMPEVVWENILGYHAFTGCDSNSSLSGFGKKISLPGKGTVNITIYFLELVKVVTSNLLKSTCVDSTRFLNLIKE